MTDVFISYKREEKVYAERVARALMARGYKLWWDVDMLPGDEYRQRTLAVLKTCKAALVLWSPEAIDSSWVLDEAERAKKRGVLVPVMILPVEDLPLAFGQLHTHNLVGWNGDAEHAVFAPVLRAVERLVGAPEAPKRAARSKTAKADDVELTLWLGIAQSRNATDFETYLARYPKGAFADLARGRLEALRRKTFDQDAFARGLNDAGRQASNGLRGFMGQANARMQAFASASKPTSAAAPSSGRQLLRRSEIAFIGLVALIAPMLIWPLLNMLMNAERTFYDSDFERLFDFGRNPNLYTGVPLLTFGAWLYDRLEALIERLPVPFVLIATRIAVALALFAAAGATLNTFYDDAGVAAHFVLWTACVWMATLAARIVGPRLKRMFVAG